MTADLWQMRGAATGTLTCFGAGAGTRGSDCG